MGSTCTQWYRSLHHHSIINNNTVGKECYCTVHSGPIQQIFKPEFERTVLSLLLFNLWYELINNFSQLRYIVLGGGGFGGRQWKRVIPCQITGGCCSSDSKNSQNISMCGLSWKKHILKKFSEIWRILTDLRRFENLWICGKVGFCLFL